MFPPFSSEGRSGGKKWAGSGPALLCARFCWSARACACSYSDHVDS